MESITQASLSNRIKAYINLTKPGILFGNLFTATGGFLLASQGSFSSLLFLNTLLGILFIMASGCVLNNCIDRDLDAKMNRTRNRALVRGLLSVKQAIIFATVLLTLGTFLLFFYVNILSVALALFGFIVYVIFYSYSKHHSSYGTLIGSFAGATPPAIGYCAVTNQFDLGALLLFTTLVFWQMPHFYAIAIYRFGDYKKGSIPVLPIKKGMLRTKIEMMLYTLAFIASASLLTLFNYTGGLFLVVMTALGFYWLTISFKGFNCPKDQVWGREMFRVSLVVIMSFCVIIPFSLGN